MKVKYSTSLMMEGDRIGHIAALANIEGRSMANMLVKLIEEALEARKLAFAMSSTTTTAEKSSSEEEDVHSK